MVSGAVLHAEEAAPTPAPEATPASSPAPEVATDPAAPAEPVSTAAPIPPPPLPPATTDTPAVPEATASPTPDIIPMEGAPLDTQDIAPPIDQSMPDDAFTQPNAVIPDEAPPPVARALDNAQEKLRLQNIRYKEVRIQADKDPKVRSLASQAEKARTPEDKRAAFREYYRLLFKRMVAIDKSLEQKCRDMEAAYLRRLAQDRLEPTIPLNPPPTPEPLN